jgi:hypothetical protein
MRSSNHSGGRILEWALPWLDSELVLRFDHRIAADWPSRRGIAPAATGDSAPRKSLCRSLVAARPPRPCLSLRLDPGDPGDNR